MRECWWSRVARSSRGTGLLRRGCRVGYRTPQDHLILVGVGKDGLHDPGVHTTVCLGPALLASGPRPFFSLKGGGGAGSPLPPPSRPCPPLPASSPPHPLCLWLVAGQQAFHSPAAPSPALLPGNLILLYPHQSMAARPLQLARLGRSQAEQAHSGRWWKNVDKFLICNTLGKSLLPLFEDECINKARRRLQGEADERQKTRNFMAIRSVL